MKAVGDKMNQTQLVSHTTYSLYFHQLLHSHPPCTMCCMLWTDHFSLISITHVTPFPSSQHDSQLTLHGCSIQLEDKSLTPDIPVREGPVDNTCARPHSARGQVALLFTRWSSHRCLKPRTPSTFGCNVSSTVGFSHCNPGFEVLTVRSCRGSMACRLRVMIRCLAQ